MLTVFIAFIRWPTYDAREFDREKQMSMFLLSAENIVSSQSERALYVGYFIVHSGQLRL